MLARKLNGNVFVDETTGMRMVSVETHRAMVDQHNAEQEWRESSAQADPHRDTAWIKLLNGTSDDVGTQMPQLDRCLPDG